MLSTVVVAYNPAVHTLDNGTFAAGDPAYTPIGSTTPPAAAGNRNAIIYEVSVRVAVCVNAALREANCVQYASGWKPEGLIQEYAGRGSVGPTARPRLKYSIFGYLNIDGSARDGGVMRARSKYVGPLLVDAAGAAISNPAAEWDPSTGVLHPNPNPGDAASTSTAIGDLTGPNRIQTSGVINYLNRFGEIPTAKSSMKSQDPVSELYYAALRYLKRQDPVPEYSVLTGTPENRHAQADGFPVVTTWDDPITFRCQTNVMLGIGDTNTWQDKNLPGPTNATSEPAKPPLVQADTTVDVVRFMNLINDMERQEGTTLAAANAAHFSISHHNNSAYIAALAYHANTQDLRPSMPGRQTAQTYWVDVQEDGSSDPRDANMYWLATKYGGFRPPSGFDPLTNAAIIPPALWNGTGENISTGFPRPDTYFPAGDANRMAASLRRAFENIVSAVEGSGASFATNTTRLEAGARVYQASFFSGTWRGELDAFSADPTTGRLSSTPVWSASTSLPVWNTGRDLWVNSAGYRQFNSFSTLAPADQAALGTAARMDFIRGDRSNESPAGAQFRQRQSPLGTFVNSQPVFVGRPDPRLFQGATFTGASDYASFAAGAAATRRQMIYVGSNGGFLHGFDAGTGREEYAFMPNGVLRNQIATLADPTYLHRYQVDGDPTVAEVYDTQLNRWRTILVGTMGRGGRSIFALDITNPDSVQFLWERSEVEIPQLGNALNRPVIGQVANGDWRVILGNGINGSGSPQVVMIRAVGAAAGSHVVVNTAADTANGMTGISVSDTNGDFIADTAYGGDYKGNVWRITGLGGTPTAQLMFVARDADGNRQPITGSPRIGRNPDDSPASFWVFFGTGSYLNENDLADPSVQTWYGLRDDASLIAGRGELNDVLITAEGLVGTRLARVVETVNPTDMLGRKGWYIDLISPGNVRRGERMVEPNLFQGRTLIGATRIPNIADVCAPGGSGFIMAIDPFTGGARLTNFFDVNNDNSINGSDNLGGQVVSGLGFVSAPNNPTFLGRVMQVSLDDRSRETVLTDAGAGQPRRVSWREIVHE